FRLADPDRFHQHVVEPGGLAEHHRFARPRGHAAQPAARGGRPDKRAGLDTKPFHAGLVAENASARYGTRRVDREHRDFLTTVVHEMHSQHIDEGALARAWDTGDSDASRASD